MARAGGLAIAIGVALLAQWSFDRQALDAGLALAALAAVLAAVATRGLAIEAADLAAVAPAPLPARRRLVLAAGVALAALGVAGMGDNAFTLLGTIGWLGGLGLCLFGLVDRLPRAAPRSLTAALATGGPITGIIAAAAFLRLHELADLPVEAGCDIPLKLEIVRGILAGERPIYSAVFPGREVGFFYVTALYGAMFGADQFSLKLMSAGFSVATVGALYALGARWFGRAAGLVAATALAVSAWHLTISRIGYRGVLTPLVVAAAMLMLDRALARGARRDWALLGVVVGACVYTYTAALAIPFAVAGVCVATLQRRDRWAGWAAALLVAAVVALPLVRPALSDFPLVSLRARSRISEVPNYDVTERLLGNAVRSVGMFNVHGDGISTQNVPFRRQLGLASGALFLCGLGIAALRWRQRRSALTLWFLLVMQVPSVLALAFPGEVPGALRSSGTLIPACLLVALPLPLLGRLVRERGPAAARWGCGAVALLAGALLITEARETWQRYFVDYRAAQPFENYPFSRTIAAAMDGYAGRGPVYLPGYPYWLDGNALRVQLVRLPIAELHEVPLAEFDAAVAAASPPFMVVLKSDDDARLAGLRARFPDGRVVRYANASERLIFVAFTTGP